MTPQTFLGVDAGGSATQAALFSAAGRKLHSVSGKAANPHAVGFDSSAAEISSLILQLLRAARAPSQIIAVSLSGGECARLRERYEAHIVDAVCLSRDTRVCVMHDAVGPVGLMLRYKRCDVSETVGLVSLIGGTGSAAAGFSVRRGGDGEGRAGWEIREWRKCGGRGPIVGDEGSGYWIATAVLRTALRIWDGLERECVHGRGKSGMAEEILRVACEAWIGSLDGVSDEMVELLVGYIHVDTTRRGDIASVTEAFGGLARRGNTICSQVFSAAGAHLADLLVAMANGLLSAADLNVVRVDAVAAGGVWRCWNVVPSFSKGFLDKIEPHLNAGKKITIMLMRSDVGDLAFACARLARISWGYQDSELWETSAHQMLQVIK